MSSLYIRSLSAVVICVTASSVIHAEGVVGVHRWYTNVSPDPAISVSLHASLDECASALRSDVRQQQKAWEESLEDYQFSFTTHGCFDTVNGISDDAHQYWVPNDQIYWVNPNFIVEQCQAAGGETSVCAQVTEEFIEANRQGDATGQMRRNGAF
jgi:hypothetical protein